MNRIMPYSLNGLPKASFTAVIPQGKTSCRNFCVASTSLRFDLPTEVDGVQSSHSGDTHDLPVPPRCKPRFYHFTCCVPLEGVLSLPESVFLPDSGRKEKNQLYTRYWLNIVTFRTVDISETVFLPQGAHDKEVRYIACQSKTCAPF